MRILVLDATNKNTLAIVRHIGKLKIAEIDVACHQKFSISIYSKYVNKAVFLPDPKSDSEKFANALIKYLSEVKYDLLIPVGFYSYYICAQYQSAIKKHTNLIITSEQNLTLASSKIDTYKLADKIGIPYPKSIYINKLGEIENVEVEFPVVIKGPFEAGGKNVVDYAYNRADLKKKYHQMCEENDFKEVLPFLQEYIEGTGYGFFAYYEDGVCKRLFMHKRIREYPVSGGASVCAESYYDEQLKNYGLKILDHLAWNGVAMVEFKRDKRDDIYKLMEINPKFWGSLDLALTAGVNFPYFLIQRVLNQEIPFSQAYEQVRFQWILNGELFHVLEKPKALFPVLKDLFKSKNDIWFSDLKPNLFQKLKILEYFYKRLFK